MIWESGYWKDPLLAMARRLQLASGAKRRLSDRRLAEVERDVFIGFYSVRKLMHSGPKLTDAVKRMSVNLTSYPNLLRVDIRNWHRLDELYDLDTPSHQTRDLEFIAGRIIHSFVFAPIGNEAGGLAGFYFSSDRDRNERLYEIQTQEVIRVFESVGSNDPTGIKMSRNPKTGDMEVTEVT